MLDTDNLEDAIRRADSQASQELPQVHQRRTRSLEAFRATMTFKIAEVPKAIDQLQTIKSEEGRVDYVSYAFNECEDCEWW